MRRLFSNLNKAVTVLLFQEGDVGSLDRPVSNLDHVLDDSAFQLH